MKTLFRKFLVLIWSKKDGLYVMLMSSVMCANTVKPTELQWYTTVRWYKTVIFLLMIQIDINFGCSLVLWKLLLVSSCIVVWVLIIVFSILCFTSFGDYTCPQHQETVLILNKLSRKNNPNKYATLTNLWNPCITYSSPNPCVFIVFARCLMVKKQSIPGVMCFLSYSKWQKRRQINACIAMSLVSCKLHSHLCPQAKRCRLNFTIGHNAHRTQQCIKFCTISWPVYCSLYWIVVR